MRRQDPRRAPAHVLLAGLCILLAAMRTCARAELVVSVPELEKKSDPAWIHQQAVELFQKGVALINQGKFDEGLAIISQTTQLEPHVPDWHMNYGNLLFARAGLMFKAHHEEESSLLAKEAEKELRSALDLFTGEECNVQKSQCYFLMGDLAYFIHKDKQAAMHLYQESLKKNPENQEAKEAIKACF